MTKAHQKTELGMAPVVVVALFIPGSGVVGDGG